MSEGEYGFTGTSQGMTKDQLNFVRGFLLHVNTLHLGDCVGADEQAYRLTIKQNIHTIGHPPTKDKKRVFCNYDEEKEPKPYLKRNLDIAREGVDGLIATPPNFEETKGRGPGAGTWSTIRRARRYNRPIWIVFPDGTYQTENVDDG